MRNEKLRAAAGRPTTTQKVIHSNKTYHSFKGLSSENNGRSRLRRYKPTAKEINHLGSFLVNHAQTLDIKDLVRRFGFFRTKFQCYWVNQSKRIYRFDLPNNFFCMETLKLRHLIIDEVNQALIELENECGRVAS